MTDDTQPIAILAGVRILDLTRNIAGPVSTMLAAEMGADVVKVEPPGGDEMRAWPPFVDGVSAYFISCNRGKRSISLDLKAEADRKIFFRLLQTADVVVENYRPGTLERMGLGWDNVKDDHQRLVWVSVSGYGRRGPRAGAPGYDSMMQAYTGIMGITGESGGNPVRSGGSPIDIATSYLAFGTIMSGLYHVQRTGKGLLLGVSLMESGLGFMHAYLQGTLAGLDIPARQGTETMGIYPMGAFLASDGEHVLVQVSNDLQWRKFCDLIEARDLSGDDRFATNPKRVTNRDALRPLIQARLSQRPAKDWEAACLAGGVPVSHVRGTADVIADPQVRARDMVKPALLPGGQQIETWGVPIKVNEASYTRALGVPDRDQHRAEILREIGMGGEEAGA